jgi:hypothetical protein
LLQGNAQSLSGSLGGAAEEALLIEVAHQVFGAIR